MVSPGIGSTSPPEMFAFDDTFRHASTAPRTAYHHTPPPPPFVPSRSTKEEPLPWTQPLSPCACTSRSTAYQILNTYYSRLDLPPFEAELQSFKQRYQRDCDLVNKAIDLRDGKLQPHPEGGFSPAPRPDQTGNDNTTVFVGGLGPNIHADLIKAIFTPFGNIDYVKTPPSKGCGFVRYFVKADAEQAIEKMQGFEVDRHRLRLSWGRSGAGEKSGSSVGTQSLQRLVHYIEPSMASRILTAIDEVFEGNMQSFREGLQYLVIANSATMGVSSQSSARGPASLNAGAVPFQSGNAVQAESNTASSQAFRSSPPNRVDNISYSQHNGYLGGLGSQSSWSDLGRQSYPSDDQQTQADDTSLESFSPTFLGLDDDFEPRHDSISSDFNLSLTRKHHSGKAAPVRQVDLRHVVQPGSFELSNPESRSSSLSATSSYGPVGAAPIRSKGDHKPASQSAYELAAHFANLSTSLSAHGESVPHYTHPYETSQAEAARRRSDPSSKLNRLGQLPPAAPARWGSNWQSGTSATPVDLRGPVLGRAR